MLNNNAASKMKLNFTYMQLNNFLQQVNQLNTTKAYLQDDEIAHWNRVYMSLIGYNAQFQENNTTRLHAVQRLNKLCFDFIVANTSFNVDEVTAMVEHVSFDLGCYDRYDDIELCNTNELIYWYWLIGSDLHDEFRHIDYYYQPKLSNWVIYRSKDWAK